DASRVAVQRLAHRRWLRSDREERNGSLAGGWGALPSRDPPGERSGERGARPLAAPRPRPTARQPQTLPAAMRRNFSIRAFALEAIGIGKALKPCTPPG